MSVEGRAQVAALSRGNRRWIPVVLLALAGGTAAHYVFFFRVRVPQESVVVSQAEQASVAYLGMIDGNELVREQSLLLDSRPLFVPTRWNVASSLQEIARLRDEAELFSRYAPVTSLRPGTWSPAGRVDGPEAVISLDALVAMDTHLHPMAGFGQNPEVVERSELEHRGAAFIVKNLAVGPAPAPFSLDRVAGVAPPERLWNPAVFLLEKDVRSSGASPLRVSGSGSADWDAAILRYITSDAFRRLLEPGYYRITVGP